MVKTIYNEPVITGSFHPIDNEPIAVDNEPSVKAMDDEPAISRGELWVSWVSVVRPSCRCRVQLGANKTQTASLAPKYRTLTP